MENIGVFSSIDLSIKAAQAHAKNNRKSAITKHDLELLRTIQQTQGRSDNYYISFHNLDELN
jgi:hypothetical protein